MVHSPISPAQPPDFPFNDPPNTYKHLRWASGDSEADAGRGSGVRERDFSNSQAGMAATSTSASTSRDRQRLERVKSPDSAVSGSVTSGKKRKVATVPPFAKHDPPSPPTSPRLFPTSPSLQPNHPSHKPGPSLSSFNTALSPSSDLTRIQSPLNTISSTEDIDPTLPAPWWTFTLPGKVRTLSGLQARWQEHVEENERLREESEHVGKDYFDTKKKNSFGGGGEGGEGSGRLGTLDEAQEGEGGNSRRSSADGHKEGGEAGAGGRMRAKPLFKAMSLPGSRRPSTDNVRPLSGSERTFTLGLPITLRNTPGSRKNSSNLIPSLKTPQRSKSNPPFPPIELDPCPENDPGSPTGSIPAANLSAPDLTSSPVSVHGPLSPDTPKSLPSGLGGRKRHPPNLNIQLPPPAFTAEPAACIIRPRFQAQSPPTPEGWDRPFSLVSDRGSSRLGRESPISRLREGDHAASTPWMEPYESHYGNGSGIHSRENGGTETSGETLVDPPTTRRSGFTSFSRKDKLGRNQKGSRGGGRGRGRGWKEDTAWSTLRKKTVKEGFQGKWTTRWRKYLIFDARSAIYLRLFAMASTTIALAMAVKNYRFEQGAMLTGLVGSSPILTIGYAPPTIIHTMVTTWKEAFGRPIGLWGLRSKMVWVCGDLLFIALWASDLSLAISDYMSTPIECSETSPWWTSVPQYQLPSTFIDDGETDRVCVRQAVLVTFVLFTAILYILNMVLSLFRIFERVRTVAKLYEKKMYEKAEHV